MRTFLGSPRHLAFRGVAAILFGIATLAWPDVTLWALVVLWGAYALVDGTLALASAVGDRYLHHRGWVAVTGVSGIAAGVMSFVWPSITALALLFVIAAWSLVSGFALIAIAVGERKRLTGEWGIALTGILAVLLGVVLMITPGAGALAITWAIGWWACLSGGASLWLAWIVHRELRGSDTHQFRRGSHAHAAVG
ncbi:MAG TPA: HdeD family acid-resistance protein [Ilumatobacteraceae bacterium]|nr:HdeD family acid-resistance protein [Ilumatobacteraceae bacterium]